MPATTITQLLPSRNAEPWQEQLRNTISSVEQLLPALQLEASDIGFSTEACRNFALKIPTAFVRRMEVGNPRDPLLLQVLASREELLDVPGYSSDPVGETGEANQQQGIIHKYRGRVLLIVSGGCAINCRYCFRRHFPYGDNQNSRAQWRRALESIAADSSIEEVILSGGDPLVATDLQLRELVLQIADMSHVRRLRIHSRLPIVIPDRVNTELLDAITDPRLQTIMVVHANHANEFDTDVDHAVRAMKKYGITVLNQSVLLAGINDSTDALVELSQRMFCAGVLPYYLHLLDKVSGAAHFDVPEERARQLLGEVAARLPGYLVPKLVREEPGASSKTGIEPVY